MKKKVEEQTSGFEIDDSMEEVSTPVTPIINESRLKTSVYSKEEKVKEDEPLISCLRNEKVIVRFLPKPGKISNKRHLLYGGMAESATRTYCVPKLSSGLYVNVLTDSEKAYLENIMGLEPNALSVYRKTNNFWDDSNDTGISRVTLRKQDNILDLSSPEDYIKYKILLANKNMIAGSIEEYQDHPKATYQYVIMQEDSEMKQSKNEMNTVMQCYKEYGKVENDKDVLKMIIETLDGRPFAANTKLESLQGQINILIQRNAKSFLKVITDPYLKTKVLIRECIEQGIIARRGDFLYNRDTNMPLCENGEDPTLNVAARYLNNPKHQEILFALQSRMK